jgi:hypothetical protein
MNVRLLSIVNLLRVCKHGLQGICLAGICRRHREGRAGRRGERKGSSRGGEKLQFESLIALQQIELCDLPIWPAHYNTIGTTQ